MKQRIHSKKTEGFVPSLIAAIVFVSVCFPPPAAYPISEEDRLLLKKVEKDSFQYFLTFTDPETGLTQDSSRSGAPVSIAATGFAVASFAVASTNGWLSYKEAYEKIMRTLQTLEEKAAKQNGFYYHFLDAKTGKRIWNSEASSIDTALLIAGVLLAASYFQGTELEERARRLYDKVEWNWMLNHSYLFCHGWKPNTGFLPYYWDMYAEHLILLALALGADKEAVPLEVWSKWQRSTEEYNGKEIVYSYTGSLFTYQYSQAFIDFRKLNDAGINYFDNSKKASLGNEEFCASNAREFQTYQNDVWGLSASLGPDGYRPYGALPGLALHDGTIAPYGVIGSIVFTPGSSIRTIKTLYEQFGGRLYGPYGFKDAFNLNRNWWANEYLGIDQGVTLLMLENFLHGGSVWSHFMKLAPVERWIERTGLGAEKD